MRPLPPSLCQYSVLRIFKAIATRIRGKSKQTLKSPRIELGTPCSESPRTSELSYARKSLVFKERGKPEYPGKNLSEQGREPTISTHIWRRIPESIPGHIGGRLSPPGPRGGGGGTLGISGWDVPLGPWNP